MVLPMGAIWMAGGVPRPSPGPLVPSVCGGGDGGGEGGDQARCNCTIYVINFMRIANQ